MNLKQEVSQHHALLSLFPVSPAQEIYIMNRRALHGPRHFVPVPRQLGTLFFLYFSQRVLFFILKYLYYYFPSHSL